VRPATILPQSKEVQDGLYVSTVSADLSVGAEVMMVGQEAGQLSPSQTYLRLPHPGAQQIR
jgi:hypothetical protein